MSTSLLHRFPYHLGGLALALYVAETLAEYTKARYPQFSRATLALCKMSAWSVASPAVCDLARDIWRSIMPALEPVAFMTAAHAAGLPDDMIVAEVQNMNQAIIDTRNRVGAFVATMVVAVVVTLMGFHVRRAM